MSNGFTEPRPWECDGCARPAIEPDAGAKAPTDGIGIGIGIGLAQSFADNATDVVFTKAAGVEAMGHIRGQNSIDVRRGAL
jgi:hypothetical protein